MQNYSWDYRGSVLGGNEEEPCVSEMAYNTVFGFVLNGQCDVQVGLLIRLKIYLV